MVIRRSKPYPKKPEKEQESEPEKVEPVSEELPVKPKVKLIFPEIQEKEEIIEDEERD